MAKYKLLSDFYKSEEWTQLRRQLMLERTDPVKGLLCEQCGKPILKDIDCIGHHKREITPHNVNDVMISLNPSNVYGAPLSGKTTFVRESKGRRDIVLDMDELYKAITLLPAYDKPSELATNVFSLRDTIIDQIKTRTGKWQQAWIIGGYPLNAERDRLAQQLGAELIYIEATEQQCIARLYADTDKLPFRNEWQRYIQDWFSKFRPDITTPPVQN